MPDTTGPKRTRTPRKTPGTIVPLHPTQPKQPTQPTRPKQPTTRRQSTPTQPTKQITKQPTPIATGRPSKRTSDAQARILTALEQGATYEMAARAGGISYDTFNEWRKQFSEFSEAVTRAEATAGTQALASITAAMGEDWRAAAWLLERRYPQEYGKQTSATQNTSIEIHVSYTNDWRGRGTPQQANTTEAPMQRIVIVEADPTDADGYDAAADADKEET